QLDEFSFHCETAARRKNWAADDKVAAWFECSSLPAPPTGPCKTRKTSCRFWAAGRRLTALRLPLRLSGPEVRFWEISRCQLMSHGQHGSYPPITYRF